MLRVSAGLVSALLLAVGCAPATAPSAVPGSPTPSPSGTIAPATPLASPTQAAFGIGEFPMAPSAPLPADVAASLQGVIDAAVNDLDAPGVAAAVIAADRGRWAGAAGTADGTARLDPAAQFGIGSVTKTVTAAGVLQLVETGAVDLDRPIADYLLDDLPTNGATVRQVLGMRSGVGDTDAPDRCREELDLSVSMADIRALPLGGPLFEPGARFRYTNSNYLLAGALIEDVTGMPLVEVLRSGVLAEPGLERLIYQDAERPTAPVAAPFLVGYGDVPSPAGLLELGGGWLPARCLASAAGPAGGMASDALTLARWGYLLYGGWVLGDDALAAMTDFVDGYGLGAHEQPPIGGVRAIGHEGTVPGYTAVVQAYPDDGVSVAVLINVNLSSESDLVMLARTLLRTLGSP